LLVSLHAQAFKDEVARGSGQLNSRLLEVAQFKQHPYWEPGTNGSGQVKCGEVIMEIKLQ
jgi:hypothetical protein